MIIMLVILSLLRVVVALFLCYSIYKLVGTLAERAELPKTMVFLSSIVVAVGSAFMMYDCYLVINFILALF